jgi:arylsulfatase A-like enzyme
MIGGVDLAIGRLLAELERLGLQENTIIILTSDNGQFLGERGYTGKWTMHEPSIRVPLIVFDPRATSAPRGRVIEEMVLNVDIAPTIIDLAGIAPPAISQGRSLLPLLRGDASKWRSAILTEHLWDHPKIPQTEAVRTERWKFIRYPQHREFEELYDLSVDPWEEHNLATLPEYTGRIADLRRRCDEMVMRYSR